MSVNERQDHPYTFKQWDCLVQYINAFLECGRAAGCGDFPDIEVRPLWAARSVYDILYQIRPEIMGTTPPKYWSRQFLNSVVETLQAGWPDCDADPEVYFELIDTPGIVIPLTERNRERYLEYSYVECRSRINAHWYSTCGEPGPDEWWPGDFAEWYSITQNKLVAFDDLVEDDFFFTEHEYYTRVVPERFPEPIADHTAQMIAITQHWTPEGYEAFMQRSPHAVTTTYHLIDSSCDTRRTYFYTGHNSEFYDIFAPLTPKVAVLIPESFMDAEGNILYLSEAAKTLWALRWQYLEFIIRYHSSGPGYRHYYYENTGAYRGRWYWDVWVGTTTYRHFAGFLGVQMSQWNHRGQTLRVDWAPASTVKMFDLQSQPLVSIIARGQEIAQPPCEDDWHY